MGSRHQPTVGRNDSYPLPESHMLVLEDTTDRHPADAPGHIQAAILLLLAACVLLMVIDSPADFRTAVRSPAPAAQAVQQHRGGIAGAALNTVTTCEQDRACAEGGS